MNDNGSLFEHNLAALRDRSLAAEIGSFTPPEKPACRIDTARNGLPTMLVNGQLVHSRYDPTKEAEGIVSRIIGNGPPPKGIVLIGFGLGYTAEALVRRFQNLELIVIEPRFELLAAALRGRDLGEVLKRCTLLTDMNESELLRAVEGELRRQSSCSGWKLHISHAARQYTADLTSRLEKTVLRRIRKRNSPLRILVVSPLYGGSLPIARYVTSAFRSLRHHVEMLDNSVFAPAREHLETVSRDPAISGRLNGIFTTLMSETVTARALEMRAQIVFFIAQSPYTPAVLNELRSIGIPTAFWFVEDGNLFEYGKKVAPMFDVFFHIQKGAFEEELQAAGVRKAHYLPLAADPEIHRPVSLSAEEMSRYGSQISHMGAGYHNRRYFFLGLLDYDFKIWGNEWDDAAALESAIQEGGRRLEVDEYVKIFNASRINLNLHSSTYTEGVNPYGDFVNPRTFEIAATGAFQLVDERSLLPELFETGKEIVTFHDLASCRAAIDYYSSHSEEADRIGQAARERVLAGHTYRHRMEEALEVILESYEPAFADVPTNTVEELVEQAGEDRELAEFFRKMGEPGDPLTLAKITEEIRGRKGELDETEALFLLMDELHEWAKEKGVV